jgi:hypothetical protein
MFEQLVTLVSIAMDIAAPREMLRRTVTFVYFAVGMMTFLGIEGINHVEFDTALVLLVLANILVIGLAATAWLRCKRRGKFLGWDRTDWICATLLPYSIVPVTCIVFVLIPGC